MAFLRLNKFMVHNSQYTWQESRVKAHRLFVCEIYSSALPFKDRATKDYLPVGVFHKKHPFRGAVSYVWEEKW